MSKKATLLVVIVAVTLSGGLITNQVLATEATSTAKSQMGRGFMKRPAISGIISSINGNTMNVDASTTIYSIDVSGAKIIKNVNGTIASETEAALMVGDTVRVEGTISGTNIVAKRILDGKLPGPAKMEGKKMNRGAMINKMMKGEKISGSVSSISGNTLNLTSTSGSYSVNAGQARIAGSNHRKGELTAVTVGDNLNIFGVASTSSPNSIRALMIEDTSRGF